MRILFVAANLPYPPIRGDTQRSNLLFRALAALGEVDLFGIYGRVPASDDVQRVLRDQYNMIAYAQYTPPGKRLPWNVLRPLHPRWVDRLAHNFSRRKTDYSPDRALVDVLRGTVAQRKYDLIVGRYVLPTARSGALELGLPTIIDIDDIDTAVYETRLASPGVRWWEELVIRHHLRQLRRIIPQRIAAADHVWVASELDLAIVEHPSKGVLPNIPFGSGATDTDRFAVPRDVPPCVLAVGSLTHAVNRRAIDRFLNAVWPTVIDAVPDAVFRVVGSGMTPLVQKRWATQRQVEVVGFAEDLTAEYARCLFTVCPIFEGGGTKIKILESLSYGRTVVAARHSVRGYERHLIDGQSVLIADSEYELAQACIRLLRDDQLCRRLAMAGASIVERHFSFERFAAEVRTTVEHILERRTPAPTAPSRPAPGHGLAR